MPTTFTRESYGPDRTNPVRVGTPALALAVRGVEAHDSVVGAGGRSRLVVPVAACTLLICGAASSTASSASPETGIQAALPANANLGGQPVNGGAISCPSAGNCSAVGSYDSTQGEEGLLLTETAGSWAIGTEAVLPANAGASPQAEPAAVSCATAGNCSAVGKYVDSSGNVEGLLLNETAGHWGTGAEAILPANAGTPNANVFLNSISCPSAGNCSAVGTYDDQSGNTQGLLLTETAGSWAPGVEAVLPAGALTTNQMVELDSVSCASTGNCSAVGSYEGSSSTGALLLNEMGGSWATGIEAVLPPDALPGRTSTGLSSVSCTSAGNCSAVGEYTSNSPGGGGLLLTETGGSWSAGVEATLPANASFAEPSVSCASAGNCTAATRGGVLLTETAGKWGSGVVAPVPADASPPKMARLTSISCPTADGCTAVGAYTSVVAGASQGVLVTETAGSWSATEVAAPANAAPDPIAELESVSCPSAGSCSAAGNYIESVINYPAYMLFGGSGPKISLNVTKSGSGKGTVTGNQAVLQCGSTCSVSLDSGTLLTLKATAAPGSRFRGWSGGNCSGTGNCQVYTGISEQTLTATFALLPKCLVPRLRGKTLKAATHAIRSHNCTVGRVTHAASRVIEKGRVIAQRPRPGRRLPGGARVSLSVSSGRR